MRFYDISNGQILYDTLRTRHVKTVVKLRTRNSIRVKVKVKVKNRPWRPRGGVEVSLYSLTSTLDGGWVVNATPRSGRLTPGKRRDTQCRGGGDGLQGRTGRLRKISPPTGFDPRTVQHVASCYTACAIPAHNFTGGWSNLQPHPWLTNASSKICYHPPAHLTLSFRSFLRLNVQYSEYLLFNIIFGFPPFSVSRIPFPVFSSDSVRHKLLQQILVSSTLIKPPPPTNICYESGV